MRKNRFAMIFSVVIMAACMIFFIGTGVAALAKKGSVSPNRAQNGEVCEFTAVYAVKAFEVENSVNFIPTGKEHYYLMSTEDSVVRYLVRAKPSWIKKRFTASGSAVGLGQKITGVVTRVDYELKDDLREMNNELVSGGAFPAAEAFSTSYFIDARYKEFGILRIFSGVGVLAFGVLMRFAAVSGILRGNKFIRAVFGVVLLGISVLLIYTLSVGGVGI